MIVSVISSLYVPLPLQTSQLGSGRLPVSEPLEGGLDPPLPPLPLPLPPEPELLCRDPPPEAEVLLRSLREDILSEPRFGG